MDAAPPSLRFLSGPNAGHMVLLGKERITLGRAETAGITVPDTGASREHAAIVRAGAAWRLEDLGSRNGTMLNGTELTAPIQLKPGDRIRIGTTDIEFEVVAPPAAGTRLELIEGPGAPRRIALDGAVVRIGRGATVDLGEEAEAAEHALLTLRAGAWRLRTVGASTTFVNGERLASEARLKTGDRIRIGRSALEFIDGRIDDLGGQSVEGVTLATRIGAGTLGVVYRGRDSAGKEAAVKLLDPGLRDDAGAVARFIAGARAQSRVTHPNVVRVIAACEDAKQPAAVLEWAPGGALAEPLAKGAKLPLEQVLRMAKDVASALAAADERRVAHQGLRPGNILFGAEGDALVSDFGLCAPYDPLQASEGGDPRWISPEEARGGAADARTNQFSLGLLMLHALTGKPPFGSGSRAEIAQARVAGGLPALRTQLPDAGGALDKLLSRLLARDPGHRFATWEEARAAIDAVLAGREPPAPIGESLLGAGKRQSSAAAPAGERRPSGASVSSAERKASSIGTASHRRPSNAAVPARPASESVRAPSSASVDPKRPTERVRANSSVRTAPSLSRQLGIPSSAMAGIGILALMLGAIVVFGSLNNHKPASDDPGKAKPKPPAAAPSGATSPITSAPAATVLPATPAAARPRDRSARSRRSRLCRARRRHP
jgi:serine/threonine-protein kinase